MLFNIFINDLADHLSKDYNIYYFTDVLAVTSKNNKETKKIIEKVDYQCAQNDMTINKDKCGILVHSQKGKKLTKTE